jgi:stearoyl-CoA desaturase (Delta-9 desaturase)
VTSKPVEHEGLTGLLWGGAVRLFVLHHATYRIHSNCHVFGRRSFVTAGGSRTEVRHG